MKHFFFLSVLAENTESASGEGGSLRLHTIIPTMSFCEAALRHVNQADHLEKGNMQLPWQLDSKHLQLLGGRRRRRGGIATMTAKRSATSYFVFPKFVLHALVSHKHILHSFVCPLGIRRLSLDSFFLCWHQIMRLLLRPSSVSAPVSPKEATQFPEWSDKCSFVCGARVLSAAKEPLVHTHLHMHIITVALYLFHCKDQTKHHV